MKLRYALFASILYLCTLSIAQIPQNYYSGTEGKTSYELKTALHNIIDNHTTLSYGDLYNAYRKTDSKPGNVVWDMYSDVPEGTPAYIYTHGSKNCGNYKVEGDCYNREHSFPQSWFKEASPMKTDLFHVVPSDGKVNGMRSSYPFGEVGAVSETSTNGSKLGTSSFDGYSGTVFEPIDAYKGDFARSYFYMATRYEDKIAGWQNNGSANAVLNGTSTKVFDDWCLNLLLKWHAQDPVSDKEIVRNNEIYVYQHNRNPFIDYPQFATIIWAGAPADSTINGGSTGGTDTAIVASSGCVDFSNIPTTSSSSYSDRDWTSDNGVNWQAALARTDQTITGTAICFQRSNDASLQSSTLAGGINALTFVTQQKYTGSGGVISISINGIEKGSFSVTDLVEQHQLSDLNIENDFQLLFTTNGATRIALDDVCWQNYTPTRLEKSQIQKARVYPNPFTDHLNIDVTDNSDITLNILDVTGRLVYHTSTHGGSVTIDTQSFKSGIYLLKWTQRDGSEQVMKLICK